MFKNKKIEIDLSYLKHIYTVLEDYNFMGHEMISVDIQNIVSSEAYKKLSDIFWKYHNANCGPFNRYLKDLIEENEKESKNG
jgi:hypothetical protein